MASGARARILEFIDSKMDELDSADLFTLADDIELLAEDLEEEEQDDDED